MKQTRAGSLIIYSFSALIGLDGHFALVKLLIGGGWINVKLLLLLLLKKK
jgi:hypothetical protein